MLAAEALQTPRPRPPAQMRRSPPGALTLNTEGPPPPPYMLEFPSLHEDADCDTSDPVLATAKMMGIQLDEDPELSPRTIAEVSQKSREELTDLFLQAEKIIRARETELALAANLGKTLLETNEALKLRHDALLSRLPVMQPQAAASHGAVVRPNVKRSQDDPWTTDDDAPAALHSRSVSIASSSHSRVSSVAPSLAYRGRARRISASPSALHALSETNAELITELTRLRAATDSAQIEGARRLRKLEREIGGLKLELDLSQRLNAELEERVKDQQDDDRKREREERLRRLRDLSSQEQESDTEIKDFAPQGLGIEAFDPLTTPRLSRRPSSPIDNPVTSESEHEDGHSSYEASISSANSSRPGSKYGTISPGEYAVVAQLYRKVEELQEANAELGMRNRVVNERLARAERDALQLKRVYDQIGEEIGAEADVESSDCQEGSKGTIRGTASPTRSLRSLRSARSVTPTPSLRERTIGGLGEPFSEDTGSKSRTGTRALGNKYMYKYTRNFKSRKPLTDSLFAPPTHGDVRSSTPSIVVVPAHSPQARAAAKDNNGMGTVACPSRSPSPFGASVGKINPLESSRTSGRSARSPSISSLLTTSSYTSLVRYPGRRRPRPSLGSELGEEFGADWETDSKTSRRDSLFNDEVLAGDILRYGEGGGGEDGEEDEEREDPALAALRLALNPPWAGRPLEADEDILPVGALRASPGEAFQLVAHAVAVRPNRWFATDGRRRARGAGLRGLLWNGALFGAPSADAEDPWETTRYPEVEPGAHDDHDHDRGRGGDAGHGHEDRRGSVYVRSCRRERALERLASTRRASQGDVDVLVASPDGLETADPFQTQSQLQSQPRDSASTMAETIKRTSADAVVEIWMFLQFVVVVCTFVYTMARRGPREILGAPPRRM